MTLSLAQCGSIQKHALSGARQLTIVISRYLLQACNRMLNISPIPTLDMQAIDCDMYIE